MIRHNLLALSLLASLSRLAIGVEPPVTAIAFAPDGTHLVAGSQAGLHVRSWPALEVLEELDSSLVQIHDLAFSPDGSWLAAGGGSPAEEGTIELYRWPEKERVRTAVTHEDIVFSVSWRRDSKQLASAGHDRLVQLHDLQSDELALNLAGHSRGVKAVVYLGEKLLVSAGIDQSLRVWGLPDGKSIRTLDNHTKQVHQLSVRPLVEGPYPMVVSVSDDRTIRLWQPTIGRMVRFVRLTRVTPLCVRWTADGRYIVVSCTDGHVRVVDPDTVEMILDLPGLDGRAYALAAHPDGRQFVVGGSNGQVKRILLPLE